jgi:hypothetical protein
VRLDKSEDSDPGEEPGLQATINNPVPITIRNVEIIFISENLTNGVIS